MQSRAGVTHHGLIRADGVARFGVFEPVLHVHSRAGTSEDEIVAHAPQASARRPGGTLILIKFYRWPCMRGSGGRQLE
jgi:hypothetical protein